MGKDFTNSALTGVLGGCVACVTYSYMNKFGFHNYDFDKYFVFGLPGFLTLATMASGKNRLDFKVNAATVTAAVLGFSVSMAIPQLAPHISRDRVDFQSNISRFIKNYPPPAFDR